MDIYIIIFFTLLFFSGMNRPWNNLYICVFLFMVGFAGLRSGEVGIDTETYRSWFNWINRGSYVGFIEPGWILLNRFVHSIGGSFLALLTLTSFLTLLPVFYVSKKTSPYIFFSIFIFYSLHLYCGAFNIMRQYLGVSIVLLAYYFLSQKKKFIAIACVVIAVSFHYSCIFAAIVYLWQKHNLTIIKVLLYTILCFILGSLIDERIVDILTFSEYTNIAVVRENSLIIGAFTFVIDILMFYLISLNEKFTLESFWGKMFVLSMLVLNSTYSLSYNARIYSLFAISQIIYFPLLVNNINSKNRIIPAFAITLYVSIQFWRMLLVNANHIVPYQMDLITPFWTY